MMLLLLYGFFLYQNSELQIEKETLQLQHEEMREQNEILQDDIDFIEDQASFTENIVTENIILKEQIKNFLDLVPDEIILSKVSLTSKDLLLNGVSIDQNSFQDKLEVPLSSMFHKTTVKYTQLLDERLEFISHSIIHKEIKP